MTLKFNTALKFIVGGKSIKNVVTDSNSKNNSVQVYLSHSHSFITMCIQSRVP